MSGKSKYILYADRSPTSPRAYLQPLSLLRRQPPLHRGAFISRHAANSPSLRLVSRSTLNPLRTRCRSACRRSARKNSSRTSGSEAPFRQGKPFRRLYKFYRSYRYVASLCLKIFVYRSRGRVKIGFFYPTIKNRQDKANKSP